MNDHLLDEIDLAYRVHDLSPARQLFFMPGFACPLTALAIHRGIVDKADPSIEDDAPTNPVLRWACKEFGKQWVVGMTDAFDGEDPRKSAPKYLAGHQFGRLALERFFPPDELYYLLTRASDW